MRWAIVALAPFLGIACVQRDSRVESNQAADTLSRVRTPVALAGKRVNGATFHTLSGEPVVLSFDGSSLTGLVLLREKDCFSCANLQPDVWDLERWLRTRDGRLFVVIAGTDTGLLRSFERNTRLPVPVLVDDDQWLVHNFGTADLPMIALMSARGTIMVTFARGREVILDPSYEASFATILKELESVVSR